MAQKIYALLVGINNYPPEVGKLYGCLNDVKHFQNYLKSQFDKEHLHIETLKNSEATRENIVKQFRNHLGKATKDDVAVFQYSGHGARWKSAAAFKEFYPEGLDEGLVCYDSRRSGGFDLADKELAVLIAEVAKNNPHLVIILDCCHSGSGTRDADAFKQLIPRQTHEVKDERPLDSYLGGYYAKLKKKDESLFIPTSKHILLAACERKQKACEAEDSTGVFTSTMLEVLEKSGSDISYADLFMRCRAAVRKRATNQNPQFESYQNFPAYSGFLGRALSQPSRGYSVSFDTKNKSWKVNAGALHGLPTEAEKSVGLALYAEDDMTCFVGNASSTAVGAHDSKLQLDFAGDTSARYSAEITSLPVAPIPVYLDGDDEGKEFLKKALAQDGSINAIFTDSAEGTRYGISAQAGVFLLKQRELDLTIQGVKGIFVQERDMQRLRYSEQSAREILSDLKRVVRWEKGLELQNHSPKMDTSLVDFVFVEELENGEEHEYHAGDVTLDIVKSGEEWRRIRGKIKARKRIDQKLYLVLVYFSNAYGVHILRNDELPKSKREITLWGEDPDDYFYLEENVNESIENFRLIVSTEKVDDFLLAQEDLVLRDTRSSGRPIGTVKPLQKYKDDWFTKPLCVKVVRQFDQVGAKDLSLAQGKIVVKAHPTVKANVSLSAAKTPTRGGGDGADFYKTLEQEGLELLNFATTRGENESILELTDIQNEKELEKNPLEIQLNVQLDENEGILPLVFDGKHVLLAGDPSKDDDGNTHISIDHITEVPDNRRGVGKALKLYFFKTYLKKTTDKLCWVEFKADGSFELRDNMVADKVKTAKNILLLLHGIIGDTEIMVKGLQMSGLQKNFDLVLTYDYENLTTSISKTAEELKEQLAPVGLHENDDKKLTLLVHSMGGLVSRWFIEELNGNKVVDHLVMCGTPNNGSPFGKIDTARKILNTLTGFAVNYIPAFVPFSSAIIFLLNRSKKITPTLEEMNPSSEIIKTLNTGQDPGVRYTILAGNVEEYKEPSGQFFSNLLVKVGKGVLFDALFARQDHDLAVSVESILGVSGAHKHVACHHLNYFVSEAGRNALAGVEW